MNQVAIENLNQVKALLRAMREKEYTLNLKVLSQGTVGQHVRHILEFYVMFINGLVSGEICYDKRERDLTLETELEKAVLKIDVLIEQLSRVNNNKIMNLTGVFNVENNAADVIPTSVFRELAYCVEHSIHHQALIKSGLIEMGKENIVSEAFGVAYSTLKYRKEVCAQ